MAERLEVESVSPKAVSGNALVQSDVRTLGAADGAAEATTQSRTTQSLGDEGEVEPDSEPESADCLGAGFYLGDQTVATPWEGLVSQIEGIVRFWGLEREPDPRLQRIEGASRGSLVHWGNDRLYFVKRVIVPVEAQRAMECAVREREDGFVGAGLGGAAHGVRRRQPRAEEEVDGVEGESQTEKEKSTWLLHVDDIPAALLGCASDFEDAGPVHRSRGLSRWFGLTDFVLVEPADEQSWLDDGDAVLFLSAFVCAMASTSLQHAVPAFVPVGRPDIGAFVGHFPSSRMSAQFSVENRLEPPPRSAVTALSLLEQLSNHLAVPMQKLMRSTDASLRRTYVFSGWASDDPVEAIHCVATWERRPIADLDFSSVPVDWKGAPGERPLVHAPQRWGFRALYRDRTRKRFTELIRAIADALDEARRDPAEFSDFVALAFSRGFVPSVNDRGASNPMGEPVGPSNPSTATGPRRGSLSRRDRSNTAVASASLPAGAALLSDVFALPVELEELDETVRGNVGHYSCAAPPGSLVFHLAMRMAEQKSLRAMAAVWAEFLLRLRWYRETSSLLPATPWSPPQAGASCWLHQKLQTLNYCMRLPRHGPRVDVRETKRVLDIRATSGVRENQRVLDLRATSGDGDFRSETWISDDSMPASPAWDADEGLGGDASGWDWDAGVGDPVKSAVQRQPVAAERPGEDEEDGGAEDEEEYQSLSEEVPESLLLRELDLHVSVASASPPLPPAKGDEEIFRSSSAQVQRDAAVLRARMRPRRSSRPARISVEAALPSSLELCASLGPDEEIERAMDSILALSPEVLLHQLAACVFAGAMAFFHVRESESLVTAVAALERLADRIMGWGPPAEGVGGAGGAATAEVAGSRPSMLRDLADALEEVELLVMHETSLRRKFGGGCDRLISALLAASGEQTAETVAEQSAVHWLLSLRARQAAEGHGRGMEPDVEEYILRAVCRQPTAESRVCLCRLYGVHGLSPPFFRVALASMFDCEGM